MRADPIAKTRHALIVGGGIAGLATGLALHHRGWQVSLFEQAPEFKDVGAGLQISPNGVRALNTLGLGEAVCALATAPPAIEMRIGQTGQRVFSIPMGPVASQRWGAPYLNIHRADLQSALLNSLQSRAPDAIRTHAQVTETEQTQDSVHLTLATGEQVTGDLLVGADGLQSTVRAALFGAAHPRFTGYLAWRATLPMDRLNQPIANAVTAWVGPGRHAVTYPLRHGALANFVSVVPGDARQTPESWSNFDDAAQAKAAFAGWQGPVPEILAASDTIGCWPLFSRAPLPDWHRGCTVILGDAAHPMLPSLAQGACMALEDAVELGRCLEGAVAIEPALTRFYATRHARTARVQATAERNLRTFHRAGLAERAIFHGVLAVGSRLFPRAAHRRLDWLYGYEPAG